MSTHAPTYQCSTLLLGCFAEVICNRMNNKSRGSSIILFTTVLFAWSPRRRNSFPKLHPFKLTGHVPFRLWGYVAMLKCVVMYCRFEGTFSLQFMSMLRGSSTAIYYVFPPGWIPGPVWIAYWSHVPCTLQPEWEISHAKYVSPESYKLQWITNGWQRNPSKTSAFDGSGSFLCMSLGMRATCFYKSCIHETYIFVHLVIATTFINVSLFFWS